jgi:DNA-binding SARP family transcriptional activator
MTLQVRLLGTLRPRVEVDGTPVQGLESARVQELLTYILLHRRRPHARETLAGLLWRDSESDQSRKYLRQALWQLQTALDAAVGLAEGRVLVVESDWVGLNPHADLWLDVAEFERAAPRLLDVSAAQLSAEDVGAARQALELYTGDLLDGWYQDWCLFERERLQTQCLRLLDKLMRYAEAHGHYEQGIAYGVRLLGYDRAREPTHRGIMRLQYLAGDRTAALRQYERCVAALQEELGVEPDRRTTALYQQIRLDRLEPAMASSAPSGLSPSDLAASLRQLQTMLADLQTAVERDVKLVERTLQALL